MSRVIFTLIFEDCFVFFGIFRARCVRDARARVGGRGRWRRGALGALRARAAHRLRSTHRAPTPTPGVPPR